MGTGYLPTGSTVRRLYVTAVVSIEKQWARAQELVSAGYQVWFHCHPATTPCNEKCKFLEEG